MTVNQDKQLNGNAPTETYNRESSNLQFWMIHGSWNYCKKCKRLIEQKLLPRYAKRPEIKTMKQCDCQAGRYIRDIKTSQKN